ncbi:NitT/TauT family transport system substrate-binding protein [Catenulispora sp. MAP5-51]|uniref:ABC transporter substrate-binding protein n=1 Tax=Catenulispora sp. MAP5-51 TaxID=3156298 RepID=UPI003512BCE3
MTRRIGMVAAVAMSVLLSACVHAETTASVGAQGGVQGAVQGAVQGGAAGGTAGAPAASLRLGYFANVTHTTAIVGVAGGYFAAKLGPTKLSTQIFSSGPDEMTALLSGQLDAAYVGPSSALNAFVESHGRGLAIVAGAEDAGAELVVSPRITSVADLRGRTIADPQVGNTQDVALRYWLGQHGYATTVQGSGDVKVQPADNATTLTLFENGRIDGAWVPEPWASRLVLEGGGHVLVDERTLWPGGDFATTDLVVATGYLARHPQTIRALIGAHIAANTWVRADPVAARALVNAQLAALTGTPLKPEVIARAWGQESVTDDPVASSLRTNLDHAVADGLIQASKASALSGIFDLTLLNQALAAVGQPAVSADGLGAQ